MEGTVSIDSCGLERRGARRQKVRLMFILFCNQAAMVRVMDDFRQRRFLRITSAEHWIFPASHKIECCFTS